MPTSKTFAAVAVLFGIFGAHASLPDEVSAAAVHEHLVASVPAPGSRPGVVAGSGYVAWIDGVRSGSRRVAVRSPSGTTRRAWLPGDLTIDLRNQLDHRTAKTVTRLVTIRLDRRTGTSSTTLRSPVTLRPVRTAWDVPSASVTIDGATSVRSSVLPDPYDPAGVATLPPSHCEFSFTTGAASIPALPDCAEPVTTLHGDVIAVTSSVPSASTADRGKGQVNTSAVSILSMRRLDLGWRRLAVNRRDYDASTGVQSSCATDQGVALLEGERRTAVDRAVVTWTLRWVPADPNEAGWTGAVPQLDDTVSSESGSVELACTGTTIYALDSGPRGAGARATGRARLVRFTRPT